MNWGNPAIGKINSVLHGLEADIKAGASTLTDPQFLEDGRVRKFSLVLANFPFSDEFCAVNAASAVCDNLMRGHHRQWEARQHQSRMTSSQS
jgi:type I restriction-modification system DNA methylase subunit